jgi:hypothetical protein
MVSFPIRASGRRNDDPRGDADEVAVTAVDTDVIERHRRANLSSRGDVFG